MFGWRSTRRKATGSAPIAGPSSRSPPPESPSTSLAPTPEPRLPSRQPSDEQHTSRGRSLPKSAGWTASWASAGESSAARPIVPPTPPSTTSQSDDEEDEPDNKPFADKSFAEEADLVARSAPAGGRMPSLMRRQSERPIPDAALDWLRHTTMPGSYKGKEVERGRKSSLQRRHTVMGHRTTTEVEPQVVEPEAPALPGLANTLPQEIILHIMRNMHTTRDIQSAMLVSRSWCICAVSTIWSKPSCPSREALTGLIRVLRTCPPPEDLQNGRPRSSRPPATFPYASFIRRLNFVPLRGSLTNEQLLEFAYCTRVERLTLAGNRGLGTETLIHLLSNMREMVAVDLSGVTATTDAVLAAIATASDRLQGVNITGCSEVSDAGVLALAQGGRLLRRIKLTDCLHLTDASIVALATQCPLILEYDLQGLDQMTDESMRQIWLNSAQVRELRLNGNARLTDEGFPRLRDYPTLPTPDTERSGWQPWDDTDAAPPPTLRTSPVTRRFDYLRTLDLTGCDLLTDVAIDAIVSNAPRIRTLTLAKCTSLTDASLEAISRLGKHLHYVHLGHVNQITDAAVTKLVRSCTRMRYVDLACCSLLTDMTVFEIATNLPKLRRIGLVKVVNITDQAIYALVEKAERATTPCLERVHLSYCDRLSVKAITHLLRTVPHITHLSLTGVSSFRQPEFQRFCRAAPAEFNSHQRAAFCVFSGKGVADLRAYLMVKEASETSPRAGDEDRQLPGGWTEGDGRASDDSATLQYRRRSSSTRLIDLSEGQPRSPLAATMVSANHNVPAFFAGQAPAWESYTTIQSPTPTTVEDGRNTIDYLDQMLDRVRMGREGGPEGEQRARRRH